ncbi:MAG: prephenate dehydrogenase/arogenate dehydrogenase family protein [Acidimicrobiia bacterium]
MAAPRRVALVGTGLIGGSVGLAFRRAGSEVLGFDPDRERAERARDLGAIDLLASTMVEAVARVDLVVVAVPVGSVADVVIEALDAGAPLVTDVGSVKGPVVAAVEAARPELAGRFVGGHPMAGSEQEGLDGARVDLFAGATWVLTPTPTTDPAAFAAVRTAVGELGADTIALAPDIHDALVAVVSHVPQLAASTLMNVADAGSDRHAVMLRLAAGGFRDMTRIASGHPGIWPDICVANRDAIVTALDGYLTALMQVRAFVSGGDRDALRELLEDARRARRNLPTGLPADEPLVELRIPIPDEPGQLAEVTTIAARLGVNIIDFEMAHSLEGNRGVVICVVPASGADTFEHALVADGYHVGRTVLG